MEQSYEASLEPRAVLPVISPTISFREGPENDRDERVTAEKDDALEVSAYLAKQGIWHECESPPFHVQFDLAQPWLDAS